MPLNYESTVPETRDPQTQVWRLYWSSWLLKLLVVPGIAAFVTLLVAHRESVLAPSAAVCIVVSLVLAGILGYRLKQQFARPQARLVPGFAGPHVQVAVIIALVLAVVLPWMAAARHGQPPLGIVALSAAVFVYVTWVYAEVSRVVTVSFWLVMPSMVLWVRWLESPAVKALARGEAPLVAWALLVAAGGAWALLLRRLVRLTEDDRGYRQNLISAGAGRGDRMGRGSGQLWGWNSANLTVFERVVARPADVPEILKHPSASRPDSLRLWRIGSSNVSMRRTGLLLVLFLWLFSLLVSRDSPSTGPNGLFWMQVSISLPFFGVIMTVMQLAQRYQRAGMELLRPVSRRTFASRLVLAAAWDLVEFTFMVAGVSLLIGILASGGSLDLRALAISAVAVAGFTAAIFGFGIWASSLRCPPLTAILLILAVWVVLWILEPGNSEGNMAPARLTAMTLAMSVAGGAFFYLGYRRWSRIELG